MSVLLKTDVTSVKFYRQFILAGIGSWLHIFEDNSSKLKQKFRVFYGQKIYGIVPSEDDIKLILFGGKQFTIIRLDVETNEFHCCIEPISCDDWLHSVIWLSNNEVAVLTAHNVVEVWNTEFKLLCNQKRSTENSILYSGLLVKLLDDVLVLCGTVFSEVLIKFPDEESFYHLKGHKGVIFSISCDCKRGIIVTTSDDRSVRVWEIKCPMKQGFYTKESWKNIENITCLHELYGHGARVMRNCILNEYIVSIGEDSAICYWGLNGKLLKKITSHRNACIWTIDANDDYVVTGGGDAGVVIHPLSMITDNKISVSLNLNVKSPKKIAVTAKNNIVIMTDYNELIYYNINLNNRTELKLCHKTTYKLLSISSCKQLIAVADMSGKLDIFIENCKENTLNNIIDAKLEIGKIMSMHWAGNRHLVFCAEIGRIIVLTADNKLSVFANFSLPQCKERWLTAVAMSGNNLIAGDRCGNLHIYVRGESQPIKTFKHINGRYGPTSIRMLDSNEFLTTGRQGTIKYFTMTKYMSSRDLEYQWVEKFIDHDNKYVCGFQERTFIVYDLVNNMKVLKVECGGGHRSWDVIRYIQKSDDNFSEYINFIYIKGSTINSHTFQLNKIMSRNILNGTHSKEINCLTSCRCPLDFSLTYLFSGGEDTTLRITSLNSENQFKEELLFRQLSSIRTVKIKELNDKSLLVVSAGGRAQVCVKRLLFKKCEDRIRISVQELVSYMIKGTDKERVDRRKTCENDFDPETRVMDLELLSTDDVKFSIFAGCSDGKIRLFEFNLHTSEMKNTDCIEKYLCFLKVKLFELAEKQLLISSTSHSFLYVWSIPWLMSDDRWDNIHKSGINCIDVAAVSDKEFLMATGGDDNAVSLSLMSVDKNVALNARWTCRRSHCSQVTGVILIDNLLLSASIDQRVTLFQWSLVDGLKCDFRARVFTDVADVQGMRLLESDESELRVCVFGKGLEVIGIPRPPA